MILRDYQTASVEALVSYWSAGGGGALIELPTGSGKSLVAAEIIRRMHQNHSARIVLLSHVRELLLQDRNALQSLWPDAPVGTYSAGLNIRQPEAPIVIAGVQSVYRQPAVLGRRDVVIIDEAHLLSRKDDGQYQQLLVGLRAQQPRLRMVGLTATPFRLDSGLLTDSWRDAPALFDEIVYRVSALDLINRGILCPILPYMSPQRIDMSGVRITAGDFNKKEMQAACDKGEINARVAAEVVAAGADRRMWIVFAAGTEHAAHLRDLFRQNNIVAEMILGDTPSAERADILERARAGEVRCLVGANVMTTGLDLPAIDLIAMVRPTKSKGLWMQMLGRGLRTSPLKENCLCLDYTANSLTHGPLDLIDGSKADGGKGKPPVKECESCHAVNHISAKVCKPCGAAFPVIEEIKYSARAAGAPIMSDQSEPEWVPVEGVIFRRHEKEDAAPSLRIDYVCGVGTISHWCAIEHETSGGYARNWWRRNSYSGEAPETVDAAMRLCEDLRTPGRIQVVRQGRFWRILNWDYSIPPGKIIPVQRSFAASGFRRTPYMKAYAS